MILCIIMSVLCCYLYVSGVLFVLYCVLVIIVLKVDASRARSGEYVQEKIQDITRHET